MALHGPIKVNQQVIGVWLARRSVRHYDPDQYVMYECEVHMIDGLAWTGRVEHIPSRGALVLMYRVIDAALTYGTPRDVSSPDETVEW